MIRAEQAHLRVQAGTHAGMTGKQNEDLFSVSAFHLSATDPTPVLFSMVADGVGGHRAGEIAAEIAVEMISQSIAESDGSQPTAIMEAAMLRANQAIVAQAEADTEKQGMATTCVCAWVIGDKLYVASVGNSRLYLLRGDKMHQVNVDHTWVQEAMEAGILKPEQMRGHPNANIIRKNLGTRKPLEVDFRLRLRQDEMGPEAAKNQGTRLLPGDVLLLCSDGLSDMVDDGEIFHILSEQRIQEAVPTLIQRANERGGRDNITAVAIEVPGGKRERKQRDPAERRLYRIVIGLTALAAFVFLMIVGLIGLWALGRLEPPITPMPAIVTQAPTLTLPAPSSTLAPTATATLEPTQTVQVAAPVESATNTPGTPVIP